MGFKRGQAAMEYLMTYGWAILVIVIVLAALLYLGVFNLRTPELCQLQVGTTCSGARLTTAGAFNFTLTNGLQKKITVTHAACSSSTSFNASLLTGGATAFTDITDVTIDVGSAKAISGYSCYIADGSVANGTIGDDYRGKLYLRYYFQDEGSGSPRVIIGDVATKFQP